MVPTEERRRQCGRGEVRLAWLLLVMLVLGSVGCVRHDRRVPVRIYLDSAPGTLDPHRHNQLVIWSVLCNVYDALVSFTPEMRLEPALARSWDQVSPTQMRFHLRSGVVFHDGTLLTARDVVASFERARDMSGPAIRHHLVGIRGVVAEDDTTVVVETEAPAPTLLNRLAFLFVVPASTNRSDEITEPVGTGSYRFVGRTGEGSVRLAAFDGWRGRPKLPLLEFRTEPNDDTRAQALFLGQADLVRRFPEALLGDLPAGADLRAAVQPGMPVRIMSIVPGAASGEAARALADPRVRWAMLHAIDRAALVEEAFGGNGIVASQYVHPVVFGYDPTIQPVRYDLSRARELLAEAGFPDGFEVELAHGQLAETAVAALLRGLSSIGIRVTQRTLPFSELIDRAGEMPLFYYARTCTTGDASDFLGSLLHTRDPETGYGAENWGGYSNPEADALIEAADRELDPLRRLELLQQAQRVVLVDLPILPLAIRWSHIGLSARIDVPTRHDEWLWAAGFSWRR